jgi:hypothetical protein
MTWIITTTTNNLKTQLNVMFFFSFCLVYETRYEKIKPKIDAAKLDDCKELRFHVPSRTDYFTR